MATDGEANLALLFWHGESESIAEAISVAMDGRTWHLSSLIGLTDEEWARVRDALYGASRAIGFDMGPPTSITVEQERDDPRVFHVIDAEYDQMATLIASGCCICNPHINYAETRMPMHPRVLTGDMFTRMRPRRRVYLDGEDQSGLEVVACILGPQGWVLRNSLTTMFGMTGHHLCFCGSGYAAVELFRAERSVDLGQIGGIAMHDFDQARIAMEQLSGALHDLALAMAGYYKALLANGVPHDAASMLTAQCQQPILALMLAPKGPPRG